MVECYSKGCLLLSHRRNESISEIFVLLAGHPEQEQGQRVMCFSIKRILKTFREIGTTVGWREEARSPQNR